MTRKVSPPARKPPPVELPRDVSIFDLTAWQACEVTRRTEALAAHIGRKPRTTEGISVRAWLDVTPDTIDVLHVLRYAPGGLSVLHSFACDCVEHVMPLWSALVQYDAPQDTRPEQVLAAARLGAVPPADLEGVYDAHKAMSHCATGVAYAAWAVGMGHHARAVNAAAEAHETHAARVEERQWQRARLVEILCPEGGL